MIGTVRMLGGASVLAIAVTAAAAGTASAQEAVVHLPPATVTLNPIDPGASPQTAATLLSVENALPLSARYLDVPTLMLPGIRCLLDYT